MAFIYRGQKLLKYLDMRVEITVQRIGRRWAWSCSIEFLDMIKGKRLCLTQDEAVATAENVARSVIDAGLQPLVARAEAGVWPSPARSPGRSPAHHATASA
jgi:hypothetical protein